MENNEQGPRILSYLRNYPQGREALQLLSKISAAPATDFLKSFHCEYPASALFFFNDKSMESCRYLVLLDLRLLDLEKAGLDMMVRTMQFLEILYFELDGGRGVDCLPWGNGEYVLCLGGRCILIWYHTCICIYI